MLRVIKYFAKLLKIIRNDTFDTIVSLSRTVSEIFSVE